MELCNTYDLDKYLVCDDLSKVDGDLSDLQSFIQNKELHSIEILNIISSISEILNHIEEKEYILGSVDLEDFFVINKDERKIILKLNRRLLRKKDNLYKYIPGNICAPEVLNEDDINIDKSTDVNILGKILVKLIFNNRIKYNKYSEERFLSYNINLFGLNLPLELHTFIGKSTSIYNDERYESVKSAKENLDIIINNFYENRGRGFNENLELSFVGSGKTHVGEGKLKKYKLKSKDINKLNEDSALILKGENNKLFFMIADGVSNCSFGCGYEASNIVKQVCNYNWNKYQTQLTNKSEINDFFEKIVSESCIEIFKYVESELDDITYEDFLKSKGIMSTTISAGIIINNKLYYISLGDTPMYVFSNDNNLTILNNEDNLGKRALTHYMSLDKYNDISSKSSLTKYIGGVSYINGKYEPKIQSFKLQEFNLLNEDILLICSDGLTDYIDTAMRDDDPWSADMTLREILIKEKGRSLKQINEILVNRANELGGGDNITSILLKLYFK